MIERFELKGKIRTVPYMYHDSGVCIYNEKGEQFVVAAESTIDYCENYVEKDLFGNLNTFASDDGCVIEFDDDADYEELLGPVTKEDDTDAVNAATVRVLVNGDTKALRVFANAHNGYYYHEISYRFGEYEWKTVV